MASYRADFHNDAPLKPGWQYLWNAPTGWDPTTNSTGDMATGSVNDPSSFRPMLDAGTYWTADGDTDGLNHGPDSYVKLTSTGGHPGAPAGFATGGGTNGLARYAIAAYTFSTDGYYAIANSWLNKPSTVGDAVEVRVSVNGGSPFVDLFANPGATVQYDAYLGQLHAGDTVYVAFGPNTSHTNDAFGTDFSIVETSARPEPLRSLTAGQHFNVADYGATPDDATNDAPAIQAALNAANTWQQQNHLPVEVDFAPGQYRLYAGYVAGSPSTLLALLNARDMVIAGNGAQLLVTDPSVGAFSFHTCSNLIVQGFTIDYETVPFTQGYITQVIDANNFVLDVQPGFPAPTDPQFVNASAHWGYPVDPVIDGRIRQDAYNYYNRTNAASLGGSRYQITISSSTSTLHVGDRYVELARTGLSIIHFAACVQVSVIGVTAYAGPGVFVGAQLSDAVNVIDCHAAISPGRWKSLDADGVHIQSARVGAWIESSSLEGLSDDSMAFYTVPFAVMQVISDTQFKVGALLNRGSTVGNFSVRHFRPGDHLTFFTPSAGTSLGNVRVTAVDLAAQTITVDQPVTGITTGTTSLVTNVYNTDLSGSFMVQGNTILNGRRYGMFIKASNGQVLNNRFEGLSHEAISIYNDPGWPEGLWGGNILIQGNAFVDNGFEYPYKYQTSRVPGAIGVHAEKLGYLPVDGIYVHPNIQIIDNTFESWRRAAIAAGNVENLEIRGNHFLAPAVDPLITQDTVIVLTSASGATVADNSRAELASPDAFLTQDGYSLNVVQSGNWIDHPPTAISLTPTSVPEHVPVGTVVGDLACTDADTSDTFTYMFLATDAYPDNAAFAIEAGKIKTAIALDYEQQSTCTIFVRTTDSGAMWFEQKLVITVTDVNDAPLMDNTGMMSLTAINEDDSSDGGTLVSAIVASAGGDRITDADAGPVEGIAIIGADNTHGTWQYKIGLSGTWTDFGAPSTSAARLLPSDDATWIRFTPSADWNGIVTEGITFRAWDQSSGMPGGNADTTNNGGSTAFSTATETAAIIVNPVNDSPSFAKGADQAAAQGSGLRTVDHWATGISAGPANEIGQTLSFYVVTDNDSLFAILPAVDAAGVLTYTPADNRSGTTTVSVWLMDNGGTENGGEDTSAVQTFTVTVQATIAGRNVFYNNSYFDGSPAAGRNDDNAIAIDKQAMLPGQKATFANYSSYSKGLNGIMVDIAGLAATPTAADFQFRYGNATDVGTWTSWTGTPTITVRAGEGTGGSDRLTVTWPDYNVLDPFNANNARAKTWLEVTVLATANTGLAASDVFYFGNAPGESGNSPDKTYVDAFDFGGARDNPHNFLHRALVTDVYDYDRNSLVDAGDLAVVRDNNTNFLTSLTLITAPASTGGGTSFAVDDGRVSDPGVGITEDSSLAESGGTNSAPPAAALAAEQWIPWIPRPDQVEIRVNTGPDGNAVAHVRLICPSSGYRVLDFGQTMLVGNQLMVAIEAQEWTGISLTVITELTHEYDLNRLPAGDYLFTLLAGGQTIASQPFSVGSPATVGVYDPATAAFHLRNRPEDEQSDAWFPFDTAYSGSVPLMGDWNGDGQDTPAMYDPATGMWYLTNKLQPGDAEHTFMFGIAGQGWKPLVGDWNGDGQDGIGLYEPATSLFFFKNSFTAGDADEAVQFGVGSLGWQPIIGDWDGLPGDGFGFYEPAISAFWLKNAHTSGDAEEMFQFGMGSLGWTPLAGDWDGLPGDGVGFYVPETGQWFLKNAHTPGDAEISFTYGIGGAGWRPLVGCWGIPRAPSPAPDSPLPTPSCAPAAIDRIDLAALAAEHLQPFWDHGEFDSLVATVDGRWGRKGGRRI